MAIRLRNFINFNDCFFFVLVLLCFVLVFFLFLAIAVHSVDVCIGLRGFHSFSFYNFCIWSVHCSIKGNILKCCNRQNAQIHTQKKEQKSMCYELILTVNERNASHLVSHFFCVCEICGVNFIGFLCL